MQISDKEKYRQNLQTKFANRAGLALFSNLWYCPKNFAKVQQRHKFRACYK